MADEKNTELDDLAFDIFAKRTASHPITRSIDAEAMDAYRKAEAFIAVKKKVRASGIKPVLTPAEEGADCRAPNLRKTHPLNLVSRVDGDLSKVSRIKKFLDANPTPERDPDELVNRLNREFTDLGWDLPTINTARAVFPAYCKN